MVFAAVGRCLEGGRELEEKFLALYVDVVGLLLAKPVGSDLRVGDLVPHELEADGIGLSADIVRETGPDAVEGAAEGIGGPVRCFVAGAEVLRPVDERFLMGVKLDPRVRAQERRQPRGPGPLGLRLVPLEYLHGKQQRVAEAGPG